MLSLKIGLAAIVIATLGSAHPGFAKSTCAKGSGDAYAAMRISELSDQIDDGKLRDGESIYTVRRRMAERTEKTLHDVFAMLRSQCGHGDTIRIISSFGSVVTQLCNLSKSVIQTQGDTICAMK